MVSLNFSRLGILIVIFTFLCFSGWRLSHSGQVSDINIGNLSGSGHIIDSHGNIIQGVPPIHDTAHKHDYNADVPVKPPAGAKNVDDDDADPDELGSDLGVGDGSKGRPIGDKRVYVTVTETVKEIETTTVFRDQPKEVTPAPKPEDAAKTDDTPKPKGTSSIKRDFERYHGLVENYQEKLTEQDQKILKEVKAKSTRQDRIKRMYDLNGADQWLKFILDQDDSAMPPLTKFTQEFIYKWQHPDPSECADRKFLVLHHNWDGNGLGTVVHGTGWILGLAIRLNRILIYDDEASPGQNFLEEKCMTDGRRSLDCIFESFSSCSSAQHLRDGNHIKLRSYWRVPEDLDMSTSAVPPLLGQLLKNDFPDMHYDAIKYWWRTQAAAYMMRMNGPALQRLKALRLEDGLHSATTHDAAGQVVPAPVPYPLPDGSFSMHVRHGDKGIEMELIPFRKYVDRAEEFAAMNMIMTRKTCFISTEDQGVLDEAKQIGNAWISPNTTSNENWTWVWSNIPRINGGPVEQLNKFGNRTDMTIKWMQQLFFAIEAPNVVGTRGSGWNRMIDELRCIWVDCRTPYMEVGPFEDWVHYNF
ncbi:hypothetical protein H072_3879 [Dactylellina haptotyla CBS 200.50]|uniref:Uncharacterized protein n=1 Tax=Dactylellina haptotyla (strain CBS 200.50) TaxID=1284197 RepID=S8AGC2_DACHA|nr:hypothetical protein H072_3879 [Dactylellina haptotyla CBS 200.50]